MDIWHNGTNEFYELENIKVEPDICLLPDGQTENYENAAEMESSSSSSSNSSTNNNNYNNNRWLIIDAKNDHDDDDDDDADNDPEVIVLDDVDDDYTSAIDQHAQEMDEADEEFDAESFKNGQTDGTTDVIETISNHANYNYVEDDDDEDDGNFISYEELKIQHELEMAEQRRKNAIISIDESDDDLENNEFNDGEYEYVDSNKPHICKVCLKQVANRYNLKRHMMIHTGERPYGCDMCTKRFREFCDLKKHRRVHWMENGYICMVCYENAPTVSDSTKCQTCMDQEIVQKKIATVSYIEYPRMEGTKKMYNCPVCHRIFGSSHNLKRHTMIHTGEKPYKCDTCHRAFREHSTLRKHQLTHSQGVYIHGDTLAPNSTTTTTTTIDNNLYKCELCGKRFLSSTNLSEHIQLTHSEMVVNIVSNEVHPCHICSRNFRTNQHLQSHMITHS